MSVDYTIRQGDTEPVFRQQLNYTDGSIVDLTGATARFVMRAQTDPDPLTLTGTTATSNDPTQGIVTYTPTAADTNRPGNYMGYWLITFAGGQQQTFPTIGYVSITVEQNLTTPGGQQLVSLPDVKDYLSVPATDRAHDAKLMRYIDAVTPLIENITGPILLRTFDEWHAGGQYWIQLRRRPSTAIGMSPVLTIIGCEEYRGPIRYTLQIITDPAAASIYSVMLDSRTATVYRRTTGGGVIPFGAGPWGGAMPDAVHVIYQAGQQTVPPNVYEAALEAIRVNYMTTQPTGRGMQTVTDEEDRRAPLGFFMPRRCLELLSPLRRHAAIA